MKLILASTSPRRQFILRDAGFKFEVVPSEVDEPEFEGGPEYKAKLHVQNLAKLKATSVADKLQDTDAVILGMDTMVWVEGKLRGKPNSRQQAKTWWKQYVTKGTQLTFFTGYAFVQYKGEFSKQINSEFGTTVFTIPGIDDASIDKILDHPTQSPMGCCGAFGNSICKTLVNDMFLAGSWDNAVGCDMFVVHMGLAQMGIDLFDFLA